MVAYATQRPLYSFKPDDADKPVPDLAEGEPQISKDNKTITVKLRSGVKFSPPVNREVTSKDVKYAFERAFTSNVPSGYATSYFGDIKGAPDGPGKFKSIPGIKTPDDRTIVFELDKPTAVTVAAALVMPITIPVPREYAEKYDRKSPSTYDQYTVFTGPYMVRNDAEGKVVGRDPGKLIEIVRNPNWDASTDYRPAYLDEIRIEEGNDDLTIASRRTLEGDGLMCCDSGQPPIAILRRALTQDKDQLGRTASGGTRWIALRADKKPFDNLNVRKAVIAGINRESLLKTRGGREVGPIAQGYIPPGVPGFEESGGEKGFPEFDFMQHPQGDPELAKQYMLKAKAEGVPVDDQGRYAGSEKLADRSPPTPIRGCRRPRSRRASWSRWASSSTSARSRRTRSTRASATCRPRASTSARTSAGSATSRTRSRCWSRRSRARRSSRRATSTTACSTCPRSTTR